MRCPACGADVPAGLFCGRCGAHLTPERGDGPRGCGSGTTRPRPSEHVLRPSLASSMLPHLPQRSRTPFRVALVAMLLALVGFTLLKLPAAMIAVAALGGPLLFLLYLREADAFRDLPGDSCSALAHRRGAGCGLGTADRRSGGPLLRNSAGGRHRAERAWLRMGLAIPLATTVLMLVSAAVARLLRHADARIVGRVHDRALGALVFTAAATLTRLAPQLPAGVVARTRPLGRLLVEAGFCAGWRCR